MIKRLAAVGLGLSLALSVLAGNTLCLMVAAAANETSALSQEENVTYAMNNQNALETAIDVAETEEFLEKNFSRFVDEYNKSYGDRPLDASSAEYTKEVFILDDGLYGLYVDFDGDCGYMVIASGNIICELQTEGDLPGLREEDTLLYSRADSFVSFDSDGILQKMFPCDEDAADMSPAVRAAESTSSGSSSVAEDGKIQSDEIDEYVSENYPDYAYEAGNEALETDFDCSLMEETSYYLRYSCSSTGSFTGTSYTEGNCSLNAMYNVMRSWAKESLISGISYDDTLNIWMNIESDPLYRKYGDGDLECDDEGNYYIWQTNAHKFPNTSVYYLSVMPELYANIRAYAIENHDYTPVSGYSVSNVPKTMESVAEDSYGVTIDVKKTSSVSKAIAATDGGQASYLSISGSSTYGNHGVAMIGYREYTCTTELWVFTLVDSIYFYQIADGWHSDARYFDPNTDAEPTLKFCILN